MTYDGFMSYSHAADGRLASALQQGLQRLAKPWASRQALRIFRDETGLSTNPHLWSAIELALHESEWLILLACPDSAGSEWVDREISHWLATKSYDRILPVVTDGIWEWDPKTKDFTPESTAVPASFRAAQRDEPRHLDLRWAREAHDLDLRNSRFRGAVADLAAPMHGVAKDELESEDIRQHRRARRLARGAVGALAMLVVIAAILLVVAVGQRNSARKATEEVQAAITVAHQQLLVSESHGLLAANRPLATLLAVEADRRKPSADSRDALMNAVLAEPRLQRTFGGPTVDIAALADHRVAILSEDRGASSNSNIVQVWDWRTGQREVWSRSPVGDATNGPLDISSTADGNLLAVVTRDAMVHLYSGRTLGTVGKPFPSGLGRLPAPSGLAPSAHIVLSSNGQSLAVSASLPTATQPFAGSSVGLFSSVGNRWVPDPSPAGQSTRVDQISFSSDGSVVATASPNPGGSNIVVSEVKTGQSLVNFQSTLGGAIALDWTRHRVVVASPLGGLSGALWYDLSTADPSPQTLEGGPNQLGGQELAYDAADDRLGISTNNGFRIFDAQTLTPLVYSNTLPTDAVVGSFVFLDPVHILTSTFSSGPTSLWNVTGTSVLADDVPARYNFGIVPAIHVPNRYLGSSTSGTDTTVTILGSRRNPIGPPIPVDLNVPDLPANVRSIVQNAVPVACVDGRTGDIATVALATGDIIVRAGTPPFKVLSVAPGAAAKVPSPFACIWSPNSRYIGIGTYPQGAQASASGAIYNVDTKKLQDRVLRGQIAITSGFFTRDSKSVWFGGPTSGSDGVFNGRNLSGIVSLHPVFPGSTGIDIDAKYRHIVVAYQNSVRVYDARTLKPLTRSIVVGGSYIVEVGISANGRYATVESLDGWRLIDLVAQEPIGPFLPTPATSVVRFGNSTTVYTQSATSPGNGQSWDIAPAQLRGVACGLSGRNLTEQEWHEYLPWAGPRRATCSQYPLSRPQTPKAQLH